VLYDVAQAEGEHAHRQHDRRLVQLEHPRSGDECHAVKAVVKVVVVEAEFAPSEKVLIQSGEFDSGYEAGARR